MIAGPTVPSPHRYRPPAHRAIRYAVVACVLAGWLLPSPAMAQSFDCAKAQEPVDRAICASPNLRLLDSELATAFAAALKRDAPNADAIRQAQRSWARNRATCLARAHPGGDVATSAEQCLATAYADRLAVLAGPPAKPPVVAATPGSAANTPHEEAAAANAAMPPAALNATAPPAALNATPSPAPGRSQRLPPRRSSRRPRQPRPLRNLPWRSRQPACPPSPTLRGPWTATGSRPPARPTSCCTSRSPALRPARREPHRHGAATR